jgi:hypothetical protein
MICHIVLIRLKDGVTDQEAGAFLKTAKELLGAIPGVHNLRVGRGVGVKADVSYPHALVMDFDDDEALEAYQAHRDHQKFVSDILGPIQDDKQVYDYRC